MVLCAMGIWFIPKCEYRLFLWTMDDGWSKMCTQQLQLKIIACMNVCVCVCQSQRYEIALFRPQIILYYQFHLTFEGGDTNTLAFPLMSICIDRIACKTLDVTPIPSFLLTLKHTSTPPLPSTLYENSYSSNINLPSTDLTTYHRVYYVVSTENRKCNFAIRIWPNI